MKNVCVFFDTTPSVTQSVFFDKTKDRVISEVSEVIRKRSDLSISFFNPDMMRHGIMPLSVTNKSGISRFFDKSLIYNRHYDVEDLKRYVSRFPFFFSDQETALVIYSDFQKHHFADLEKVELPGLKIIRALDDKPNAFIERPKRMIPFVFNGRTYKTSILINTMGHTNLFLEASQDKKILFADRLNDSDDKVLKKMTLPASESLNVFSLALIEKSRGGKKVHDYVYYAFYAAEKTKIISGELYASLKNLFSYDLKNGNIELVPHGSPSLSRSSLSARLKYAGYCHQRVLDSPLNEAGGVLFFDKDDTDFDIERLIKALTGTRIDVRKRASRSETAVNPYRFRYKVNTDNPYLTEYSRWQDIKYRHFREVAAYETNEVSVPIRFPDYSPFVLKTGNWYLITVDPGSSSDFFQNPASLPFLYSMLFAPEKNKPVHYIDRATEDVSSGISFFFRHGRRTVYPEGVGQGNNRVYVVNRDRRERLNEPVAGLRSVSGDFKKGPLLKHLDDQSGFSLVLTAGLMAFFVFFFLLVIYKFFVKR